tara:strand:- start:45 stop:473 length:429 start_codon:yes stop_codon:yes gene_type:complete
MARVIKLKESDITNIVRRILKEDSHYWGNKGDMSKTRPNKRDYEEGGDKITVRGIEDLKKVIGYPKNMEELVSNYREIYSCQTDKKGLPTPEEIKRTADKVQDTTGDDDPVVSMIWILVGILLGVMIGLCIDWQGLGYPYGP